MDELEDKKVRLIYEQNLTNCLVVRGCLGEKSGFKQQYNSKLQGLFARECFDMKVGDIRQSGEMNESLGDHRVEILKPGRRDTVVLNGHDAKGSNFSLSRCYVCNNEFICGLNMQIRIGYTKASKRERRAAASAASKSPTGRRGERYTSVKCLVCSSVARVHGGLVAQEEQVKHADWNTLTPGLPTREGRDGGLPAAVPQGVKKKRSKKKNKDTLRHLLQRRREADAHANANADPFAI